MKPIDWDDIKNKTPALEDFLLEIAREAGADAAILFDGSEVELKVSEETK